MVTRLDSYTALVTTPKKSKKDSDTVGALRKGIYTSDQMKMMETAQIIFRQLQLNNNKRDSVRKSTN